MATVTIKIRLIHGSAARCNYCKALFGPMLNEPLEALIWEHQCPHAATEDGSRSWSHSSHFRHVVHTVEVR